jgi:hypothetical protein
LRLTRVNITTVVLLATCVAQRQSAPRHTQTLKSPDSTIIAEVNFAKKPEATAESRVVLRAKNGTVLAQRDYSSEDGEHGYGVTNAAWTPDSQFYVYSLQSSGGHSPWHSPVQVFCRADNKIRSLDDALNDAVMSPEFVISAPDRVTVDLYFSKQTKTVGLHQLMNTRRPTN